MQTGIVSGFSLHSYEPELQRYGASRMELVEQFFALDSSYALKIIKTAGDFKTLQSIAIETMSTLISLAIPNPSSQHSFTKSMFENFAREFQLSAAQFQQLNADFRLFRQDNEEVHFPVSAALKLKWKLSFQQVIKACENEATTEKMLADLIHMHINRLFSTGQRWNEMILYHYLQRKTAQVSKPC